MQMQSLDRRIFSVIMVTCLVSLLFTGAIFTAYEIVSVRDDYKEDIVVLGNVIGQPLSSYVLKSEKNSARKELQILQAVPGLQEVYLFDMSDRLFSHAVFHGGAEKYASETLQNIATKEHWSHFCVIVPLEAGTLVLYTDFSVASVALYHFGLKIACTLLFSLLIAYVLSRALYRRIFDPIHGLIRAARHISVRHDYNVRVQEDNDIEEISLLLRVFNRMLSEVQLHEKEVSQLKNYLDEIIHSMPSAFLGVNNQARVVYINAKACSLGHCDPDGVIGKTAFEVFEWLSVKKFFIEQAIAKNTLYHCDRLEVESGAGIAYYRLVVYPLSDGMGAAIQMEDLTPQIQMENRMIQNEKMISISGLAAGMAHEINNPLGGMVQTVQNIERRLKEDLPANRVAAEKVHLDLAALSQYLEEREVWAFLKSVRGLGQRIAQIIQTMLQFSRAGNANQAAIAVSTLVSNSLSIAKNDETMSGVSIENVASENPASIVCVAAEIEQVLLNILRNSAQAMHSARTVNPKISIQAKVNDGYMQIFIEDNGPGMSLAVKNNIFEPFFTTKLAGEGTGLGLALSRYIIHTRHHGEMQVHSELGHGAKFIISLPLQGCDY